MAMPYYPGKTIFLRLCFLLTAAAILFLSVCIQVNADSKQVVLLEESFTSRYITAPIEYQLNSYYDVYTPAGLNKKKTNWKKLTGPATFLFEDRIGWIKFPVSNHSSNTQWVFEVDWSKGAFVSLDMFYRAAPGDEYIKIERDARQRFYTWSLQLKPFETGSIIFRGHAPQLLSLPVRLYRAEHYALETLNLTAAVSFLISIIIALSVFNFFIGLRTRDETHLWYSLAQFGFGCFFMFYYGLDHKLYASYPRQLLLIGTCVAVYFGIVGMYFFILNYMDFRKKHPRLYPFMLGMIMCIFLAISLYGHVHTSIPATLYFIFMGGTLIFVLGVALKAAIRGDQLALYFLLIWLLVAVFLAFFDAQAMGLIERTVFTNHSILIAFALEALLFSFALGERINALAQKNFEASASARVKSEFLAQMSHEIRTPMNAIIGMSQLMGLTQLEKKQQFYNNLVQSSAESLLCIINDILDFSKIEAGKLNLEKIPFSLNELIQGVLGIFYSHVKRTDIPLYCSVHPSVPDELSGDPSRLRQVLINLVGNAFKFTADGYILLTVSVNPLASGQVKFSIRDSGCGISAAAQNKLFSAFTQVDASTSRKYGGTGLGLAISKNLTVLMGGEIGVESNEGIGSCFYFTANMVQDRCNGEADDNADSHFLENNEVENNQIQRPTGFLGFSPPAAAIIVWSRVELGDILAIYFIQFNVRVLRCGSRQQLNVMLEEHRQCLLGVFIDEQFETANKLVLAGICTPSVAATNSNHQLEGLARQADKDKNPIARQPLPLKWIFLTGDIEDRTISSIAHGFEMCRWGIINRFYDELLLDSSEADCQHHHAFETIRQGLKVLVAEDVATNQEVIRGFMEELGHEVRIVEDGIQAVQDYKQHNEDYDLILMDCAMPEMDGYEATRSIRRFEKSQIKKPALIVALTAHAFAEHREECIAAGMNDHLSKPITLKSLVNVLNRHFPEPNPNPGS